jgi:hypothetical protein
MTKKQTAAMPIRKQPLAIGQLIRMEVIFLGLPIEHDGRENRVDGKMRLGATEDTLSTLHN